MNETLKRYVDVGLLIGAEIGTKIVGAIALWIVGRLVIRGILRLLDRTTKFRNIDETLARYLHSVASVLLNILLIITVLGVFGVQTFTFAGILAATGVAIGMAWSGLLANLAAGVFMIVLRPFKAGDVVTVAGVTGIVHSIGLFVTSVDTFDNERTFLGNNKIFGEIIKNHSDNPVARLNINVQLPHGADVHKVIAVLKEKLTNAPHAASNPAPFVEMVGMTLSGPLLVAHPYVESAKYPLALAAAHLVVYDEVAKLGYPTPAQAVVLREDGARLAAVNGHDARGLSQVSNSGTPEAP
ncbi:mechanosensitive ion channel family protein [Sorangium atrum]|uniref:Mechanosensitive ion channel family protein n=1 Tax=Sorangium atrum TaxID=2995308 RepID=A0ABT5BX83_9BACT|nr:mechanosensitive ion channel family protein [Sorangium aterium]MDC0678774.1 mechanosensitive ion channel family protein [Sorangium aterium]